MSTFKQITASLQQERKVFENATRDLYTFKQSILLLKRKIEQRLQSEGLLNLPANDPDMQVFTQMEILIQQKQKANKNIQEAVNLLENQLDALGTPQQLVKNLDDGIPVLLMPLRVQTRFVTVKHVVKGIAKDHIISWGSQSVAGTMAQYGDWKSDNLKWLVTLDTIQGRSDAASKAFVKTVINPPYSKKPASGKWIKRVPDQNELWVRIYPDDIFIHSHETHLTQQEKDAGERFWKRWWEVHRTNSKAFAEEYADDSNNVVKPLTAAWNELQNSYGYARAAWIFRETQPSNYNGDSTSYLPSPKFDTSGTKLKGEVWTEPVMSFVMPDHFVVQLEQGNFKKEVVGNRIPHPFKITPAPDEKVDIKEGHWMHDFQEAEKSGMAIRINLSNTNYNSTEKIDKIIVLGIKTSTDENAGRVQLESLFENHHYKHGSMAFLPQGTPTNNFEKSRSGYSSLGPPAEEVFKAEVGPQLFENKCKWYEKKDGQYFSEALGIISPVLRHIYGGGSQGIGASIAMNHLLWSTTMGYYLEQFLMPTIKRVDIEEARNFFVQNVSGRGILPAFRIGKQPYSILPTTAFSLFEENENSFISNLYKKVLKPLDQHWNTLLSQVKQITDPNFNLNKLSEDFIRILGLNAGSDEVYQRPLPGSYFLESTYLSKLMPQEKPQFSDADIERPYYLENLPKNQLKEYYRKDLMKAFENLKLPIDPKSRLFQLYFSNRYRKVKNPLIDVSPLSEKNKLPPFVNDWNYLEWLEKTPLNTFKNTHFESDIQRPTSLLYLLGRQALSRVYLQTADSLIPATKKFINTIDFELEHLNGSTEYLEQKKVLSDVFGIVDRNELNITLNTSGFQTNKWNNLDQKINKVANAKFIWKHIEDELQKEIKDERVNYLSQVKSALSVLKNQSTASLHRLMMEHFDLCNYRLDGWMCGLANRRLQLQRKIKPRGIYLGAYGYVENLKQPNKMNAYHYEQIAEPQTAGFSTSLGFFSGVLVPVLNLNSFQQAGLNLEKALQNSVLYLGGAQQFAIERSKVNSQKIVAAPEKNPDNHGFMHTPSVPHAITAAILRSGFMANNPLKDSDEFAINLTSERVRRALYHVEGLKNGQELPALLGYQFERELHDNPFQDLDQYLRKFRIAYPLKVNKQAEGESDGSTGTKEAFNVVNGLKIVKEYRKNDENLPPIIKGILNGKYEEQVKAIIEHLHQSLDAINDLFVSESVFQAAKGNLEKSAAVLKMMNNDKDLEVPEIIHTPKRNKFLSHLVGIQFDVIDSGLAWPALSSPRSVASPHLNNWLADQLPQPNYITINIIINGNRQQLNLTNLGIQPIDFISLFLGRNALSETSELSFYLIDAAKRRFGARPGVDDIKLEYTSREGFIQIQKSIYEIKPLIDILLKLVGDSRPMLPTDIELSSRTNPLEKEEYVTLVLDPLISDFDNIINGTNNYSLSNLLYNYKIHLDKAKLTGLTPEDVQSNYEQLQKYLFDTSLFTHTSESYYTGWEGSSGNLDSLIEKGKRAKAYFELLKTQANSLLSQIKSFNNKRDQWEGIQSLSRLLFGDTFKVFPEFNLKSTTKFKDALNFPDLLANAGEFAVEEWLQGTALVRESMRTYHRLSLLRDVFDRSSEQQNLKIIQLPYLPNHEKYRWLGVEFPPDTEIPGEILSLALELPKDFKAENVQSGMIIDFWTETIPEKKVETGIALHYNQANSEPPQTILLCVTPKITGQWNWEHLIRTVTDTIEMAKKRAVEPDHVIGDTTPVAGDDGAYVMRGHPLRYLLPAISFPVSTTADTPCIRIEEDLGNV